MIKIFEKHETLFSILLIILAVVPILHAVYLNKIKD